MAVKPGPDLVQRAVAAAQEPGVTFIDLRVTDDEAVYTAPGAHVLTHEARVQEWNAYRRHVSSCEINHHLESL